MNRKDKSHAWSQMKKAAEKYGEDNDCSVIATTIAFNKVHGCEKMSYSEMRAWFERAGRKHRQGVYNHQLHQVLEELACEIQYTKAPHQPNGSRYTAATIGRAFPKGTFIVGMTGHVAAMHNGLVLDWTRGTRRRVLDIWELIRCESN